MGDINHFVILAVGFLGGLCLLWKNDVKLQVSFSFVNIIITIVKDEIKKKKGFWYLVCVYGHPKKDRRKYGMKSTNLQPMLTNLGVALGILIQLQIPKRKVEGRYCGPKLSRIQTFD